MFSGVRNARNVSPNDKALVGHGLTRRRFSRRCVEHMQTLEMESECTQGLPADLIAGKKSLCFKSFHPPFMSACKPVLIAVITQDPDPRDAVTTFNSWTRKAETHWTKHSYIIWRVKARAGFQSLMTSAVFTVCVVSTFLSFYSCCTSCFSS